MAPDRHFFGIEPNIPRREERAFRAAHTAKMVLPELLRACPRARHGVQKSDVVIDPDVPTHHGDQLVSSLPTTAPRVRLVCANTLDAASRMSERPFLIRRTISNDKTVQKKPNVTILSFASPHKPGGGFMEGANSQEEFICARSTLYPALWDEFYRLPETGGIYTPDVMVFRDTTVEANEVHKRDRYFVDVLSASMLRFPNTKERMAARSDWDCSCGASYCDRERDLVTRKMKAVMRVAQLKGVERLVLGAWGCGSYGNPIREVAKLWRKVIAGSQRQRKPNAEQWQGIKEIVFAIPDRKMASEFQNAFSDILCSSWLSTNSDVGQPGSESTPKGGEDPEIAKILDTIQEIEVQLEQSTGPRMRLRLRSELIELNSDLAQRESGQRVRQAEYTLAAEEADTEEDYVDVSNILASDDEANSLYNVEEDEPQLSDSSDAVVEQYYDFRTARPPGLDFETSQDELDEDQDYSLLLQPSPNYDPKTGWFTGSIDELHAQMRGVAPRSASHASPVLRPESSGLMLPFTL
ncbi:hypothetical protein LTR62_000082 [Meristemomyces frigidus]|uniref:Microbial-type PARG catalytic domain-containing protein n=1 Tax=Meristemomyces frigidus TaxID=1508187 RepID=A0AAN7YSV7_9PEZI|nr:hypothetical protein LTR62_000082 [Meristemomyces frigidus]